MWGMLWGETLNSTVITQGLMLKFVALNDLKFWVQKSDFWPKAKREAQ